MHLWTTQFLEDFTDSFTGVTKILLTHSHQKVPQMELFTQ